MIKKFNEKKNFDMNFTEIEKRQETFKVLVFGLLYECILVEPFGEPFLVLHEKFSFWWNI